MGTAEENVGIVRRFYEEVWDKRNVGVLDELYAPNFVLHRPGEPDLDRDGHKRIVAALLAALPDERLTVEDVFGAGDRVAARVTSRGTHQGPYLGVTPTGKQITRSGIAISRLAGGKIVETWLWIDQLGFRQQFGFTLTPPAVS